ncbi:hypothetical protein [Halobaculum magnesiiphilum]|uniref:DUF8080 domain-containing protein n=1 Tax=Halobaculum magnesiiphilum TaxID=1017351 RepID=A0A8T8WA34_9EURY|nr:hypothetical protein [Halobaculum magnesiiphilum]QZP36695.1 hypothetical protein K6T50_10295 [Halobaculum magnesiiphilum]
MPVTLDSTVTTAGGVALVAVRVRNTEPVACRVRIENRLHGPVLPPRRHGTPEPGWSDDGYDGVVAADSELALGYACRVAVDERGRSDEHPSSDDAPVELVAVGDPSAAEADPMDTVIGDLGDHRPPPDAVSVAAGDEASAAPAATPDRPSDPSGTAATPDRCGESKSPPEATAAPTDVPPAVARYLDTVEGRISRAETFADGSVADATELLEADIDPDGLAELVALDATALEGLAARADSLATRAVTVDVPTDALERLA